MRDKVCRRIGGDAEPRIVETRGRGNHGADHIWGETESAVDELELAAAAFFGRAGIPVDE